MQRTMACARLAETVAHAAGKAMWEIFQNQGAALAWKDYDVTTLAFNLEM